MIEPRGDGIELRRPVVRINRPVAAEESRRPRRRRALRVGLLGGSFNPAHEGHLWLSVEALKRLGLDQVWWLVSPQNPLKDTAEMAPFADRIASARAVAASQPRIRPYDIEQRLGTRYTADTLARLTRRRAIRFVWLIGADNLAQLPRWRRWRRIMALVPVAVFERKPYVYRALAGQAARRYGRHRRPQREAQTLALADPPAWVFLRLRRHPASATEIRRRGEWGAGNTRKVNGGRRTERRKRS